MTLSQSTYHIFEKTINVAGTIEKIYPRDKAARTRRSGQGHGSGLSFRPNPAICTGLRRSGLAVRPLWRAHTLRFAQR